MPRRYEWDLAGALLRYTLIDSFGLRRIGPGRLIALGTAGVVWLTSLQRVCVSVMEQLDGPDQALAMVLAALLCLQGLLFYLGFTWLMGSMYLHRELPTLLILPLSERLMAAVSFLPVLLRAYLLEGILAGPALAALARAYGLAAGDWLRLAGLLLVLPPLGLGLALLLLLFVLARAPGGRHVWAAAVAGTAILAAGLLLRGYAGLTVDRFWHATASPGFWGACLGLLAVTIGANGQAVRSWWPQGRERLDARGARTPVRLDEGRWAGLKHELSLPRLVRREVFHFFSIPVYVTNYLATAAAGIIMPLLLFRPMLNGETGPLILEGAQQDAISILVALFVVSAQSTMSNSSLVAFSRDGEQWWALRMLPMPLGRLAMAKLIASALLDLLGTMPVLLAVLVMSPMPGHLRLAFIGAAVASIWLQTAVRVTLDAAYPSFAWTEPLQPLRSPKRYVAYAANLAAVGGCAAAGALFRPPAATPVAFLVVFSLLELAVLLAVASFLIRQARRAEARRGHLLRRLVDCA